MLQTRPNVKFFAEREDLRAWFERNHEKARELWIGYYKAGSGRKGVTYAQAVEEALCFGWIDGQVRSLDALSYANRYSPRRPSSRWSRVNLARVGELFRDGRMHSDGIRAFRARRPDSPVRYSIAERPKELSARLRKEFQLTRRAWAFFQAQPPSYRRTASFWVMSARQKDTRRRRLRALVEASAASRRINLLSPVAKSSRLVYDKLRSK